MAIPNSVMKPTRLAIEMTGAVYAPAPKSANVFVNTFGEPQRKEEGWIGIQRRLNEVGA